MNLFVKQKDREQTYGYQWSEGLGDWDWYICTGAWWHSVT